MVQECEIVSRKLIRRVRCSEGRGKECEGVSRTWCRSVRVSAGRGAGL